MTEVISSGQFYAGYRLRMTRYDGRERRFVARRVSIMNNRKPPKGRLHFTGVFGKTINNCTIEFLNPSTGEFMATHAYDRVYLSRRADKILKEKFVAHLSSEVEKFQ